MIKKTFIFFSLLLMSACSFWSEPKEVDRLLASPNISDEEYARYVKNVTIAGQGENFITYEYSNIRVDELAVFAALYCFDHGQKRAYLDNITLYQNNNRRARFSCR